MRGPAQRSEDGVAAFGIEHAVPGFSGRKQSASRSARISRTSREWVFAEPALDEAPGGHQETGVVAAWLCSTSRSALSRAAFSGSLWKTVAVAHPQRLGDQDRRAGRRWRGRASRAMPACRDASGWRDEAGRGCRSCARRERHLAAAARANPCAGATAGVILSGMGCGGDGLIGLLPRDRNTRGGRAGWRT